MDTSLITHWHSKIRALFPNHAEFKFPLAGAANLFAIDWKLNTDAARPNKGSRQINIHFSTEAVEDYLASTEAKQSQADGRLQRFVAAQLAQFTPDHDARADQVPPAVTWVVTTAILNGP